MKKIWRVSFLLILFGCTDIIVEDISGKKLVLIGPSDSLTTSISEQVFLWERLPGAEKYRLSIAKPHFHQVELIVLDTSISNVKFNFILPSGLYEWRVRAENSAYIGPWSSRTILIDSL